MERWGAPTGEGTIARSAVCRLCGRVAYVRSESGFGGAAGEALTQTCERVRLGANS